MGNGGRSSLFIDAASCLADWIVSMKYEDIKDLSQRCDAHPDHQQGMVSYDMILQRLWEEVQELRNYIETKLKNEA